ncbi:hypothetical protein CALCODRAFT_504537 [Calocera cornea HHB12733]|uniref:Uncharacterized protein n=1 Tax=Calocera cornea HHB12733 TaxID=1353952 RepID=A0A165CCX6_9BASI|nr:hypothetical protein CALCODRAFT_504537 [Calocera cornea HHB12733]
MATVQREPTRADNEVVVIDRVNNISDEDVEMVIPSSPQSRPRMARSTSIAGKKVTNKDVKNVSKTAAKKMTEKARAVIKKENPKSGKSRKTTTRTQGKANAKKTGGK